ncbi:Glycosyltransferase-like protein, partial [Leptotrombidium deliense]
FEDEKSFSTKNAAKLITPDKQNEYDELKLKEEFLKSPRDLNETQTYQKLAHFSNLPISYWIKMRRKGYLPKAVDKSCKAEFPNLFEVHFNNIYWQTLKVNNAKYYLFSAYYDDRTKVSVMANVRILAMINRLKPPQVYCQFWFQSKVFTPVFAKASYTYNWRLKWGNNVTGILQPFTINCEVPVIQSYDGKQLYRMSPDAVSIVASECDKSTNALRVVNNQVQVKQDFAVCVKALDFLNIDLSVRLVEWIEAVIALGAKKIFLYELDIHPNIAKVINYYQNKGFVELTKTTLPGSQPNIPGFRHFYLRNQVVTKRQFEVIVYNDCLYRNINSYNYLALLDIDEVIMPLKHQNWSHLMEQVVNVTSLYTERAVASFCARNVYFFDSFSNKTNETNSIGREAGIPRHLHMLQHVFRSDKYTDTISYVKCFHDTSQIISIHNHFPIKCVSKKCIANLMNNEMVHLQHYRKDCVGELANVCDKQYRDKFVRDTSIWRYKDSIIMRSAKVFKEIGFVK